MINDIIATLNNATLGHIPVGSKEMKFLKSHRKLLMNLLNLPTRTARKRYIYKQRGGFITGVLPVVSALLGAILPNVI